MRRCAGLSARTARRGARARPGTSRIPRRRARARAAAATSRRRCSGKTGLGTMRISRHGAREFEQAARHVIARGDQAQRMETLARASRRGLERVAERVVGLVAEHDAAGDALRRLARDAQQRRHIDAVIDAGDEELLRLARGQQAAARSATRRLPPVRTTIASVSLSGSATSSGIERTNHTKPPSHARRAATHEPAASGAPRQRRRPSWHARERAPAR